MKKSAQRNEAICSKPECGAATQKPRSGYSKVQALCIKPSLLDTKKKKKGGKGFSGRKKETEKQNKSARGFIGNAVKPEAGAENRTQNSDICK